MLRLLQIVFVAADKAVATVETEEGDRALVDCEGLHADEVLDHVSLYMKVPEAEAFTDAEAKELARLREEFEATKTRKYESSQGQGQAQVALQNQMAPLERKARAASIAARVAAACEPRSSAGDSQSASSPATGA